MRGEEFLGVAHLEPDSQTSEPIYRLHLVGAVAGRVVRSDGKPVPGAVVCAWPYGQPPPLTQLDWAAITHKAKTDERGRFRITGLHKNAHYHFVAGAPGRISRRSTEVWSPRVGLDLEVEPVVAARATLREHGNRGLRTIGAQVANGRSALELWSPSVALERLGPQVRLLGFPEAIWDPGRPELLDLEFASEIDETGGRTRTRMVQMPGYKPKQYNYELKPTDQPIDVVQLQLEPISEGVGTLRLGLESSAVAIPLESGPAHKDLALRLIAPDRLAYTFQLDWPSGSRLPTWELEDIPAGTYYYSGSWLTDLPLVKPAFGVGEYATEWDNVYAPLTDTFKFEVRSGGVTELMLPDPDVVRVDLQVSQAGADYGGPLNVALSLSAMPSSKDEQPGRAELRSVLLDGPPYALWFKGKRTGLWVYAMQPWVTAPQFVMLEPGLRFNVRIQAP